MLLGIEAAEESEQVNKEWSVGVSILLIKIGKFPKTLRANYRNHRVRVNSISFGRAFSDESMSFCNICQVPLLKQMKIYCQSTFSLIFNDIF